VLLVVVGAGGNVLFPDVTGVAVVMGEGVVDPLGVALLVASVVVKLPIGVVVIVVVVAPLSFGVAVLFPPLEIVVDPPDVPPPLVVVEGVDPPLFGVEAVVAGVNVEAVGAAVVDVLLLLGVVWLPPGGVEEDMVVAPVGGTFWVVFGAAVVFPVDSVGKGVLTFPDGVVCPATVVVVFVVVGTAAVVV